MSAEFGKQGKFEVRFVYDELLANRSDTFQTPYLGAGTNNLTLPANWVRPIQPQSSATSLNLRSLSSNIGIGSVYSNLGVLTPPTAAQLAILANIVANDVPDFQNVNLSTKRTRGDAQLLFSPTASVDVPVKVTREHKAGKKATGVITGQVSSNAIIMPYQVNWDTTRPS